jgi:type IX secretion system substrate protein
MRKFTLLFALVAFTSFLFAQTANTESCELTKDDHVELAVKKSAVVAKEAGDVYWSEDFDSVRWYGVTPTTMPENWSVYDANLENLYWIWSMEGPKGAYTSPNSGDIKEEQLPDQTRIDRMNAVGASGDNGFMMLPCDWYNTGEDGNILSGYLAMDSYFQVTGIDLSDKVGATLKYNQMYRWCCSGANQLSVFVASDYDASLPDDQQTPHWIELDSRGLLAAVNDPTDILDRAMQFDITTIAAGQSNLTIRVHSIGASHYFWMIDDLRIVEPNTKDIVATRAWWYYAEGPYTGEGADPDYDWTGGYTKIPIAQKQDFVGFKMAVTNFGLNDLEDVKLKVEILKDGAEVYNETGLGKAIESTQKDSVQLNTAFDPSTIGEYQVSSTVIFEDTDQDPTNNAFSYDFEITEGIYSRVYDAPYPLRVMTGAWVSGGNPGDGLISRFELFEDAEIKTITTYFWNNSDEEQIADIEAGNFSMIGRVYKLDEETDEIANTPIISTELRQMVVADTSTFIEMPFIADGEAEFLAAGIYYMGIETYTSSVDIDFEIGEDKRVQQPTDNAVAWFSGEIGGIDSNPVLIMKIEPSDGLKALTFNVDMQHAADFDATADKVYVAGDFLVADWAAPGDEGSLELLDADGDGVYTGTVRVVPLETYNYKYFINAGWDGGEWTGDPNRSLDMPAIDFATDIELFGFKPAVGLLDISNVAIYPNPTENELNITNMKGVDRIIVSNIIGQEVMNITGFERSVSINTSNLENGVYVVTFIDANNNMQSTRIVKR